MSHAVRIAGEEEEFIGGLHRVLSTFPIRGKGKRVPGAVPVVGGGDRT
jgi:hypothetical protein